MEQNKVTKEQINNILDNSTFESEVMFYKTTIVSCQLPNGFVITESSSCVDPKNFDFDIGYNVCIERIINKLWELEGYKLQDQLNYSKDK